MSLWPARPVAPQIEEAREDDFETAAEIHATSFAHPWGEDELHRLADQSGAMMLVARSGTGREAKTIKGFVLLRNVAGEAEVLTIAVAPQERGKGFARALMQQALFRLYGDRCSCLFLEVDAANTPALSLYKALGFRKVGERKGYYRSGDGDGTALVMRVDLL